MPLVVPLLVALSGPLFSYDVKESVASETPRGRQESAVVGRVTVAGASARWELTSGTTFPRSSARAAIADRGGLTLLDTREKVYASASREEFDALFVPRAGETAGASFTPQDLRVEVTPDGAGARFADAPTARWRLAASWRYAVKTPGRAGSVAVRMNGTIVTAPSLDEARSPFDDLLRLLPVRGEAREEVAGALAKAVGLPVKVELEIVSQASSERLGAPPGAASREEPARTVTRVARELSTPARRPARAEDAALFAVPESFHSRGLEKLAGEIGPP